MPGCRTVSTANLISHGNDSRSHTASDAQNQGVE